MVPKLSDVNFIDCFSAGLRQFYLFIFFFVYFLEYRTFSVQTFDKTKELFMIKKTKNTCLSFLQGTIKYKNEGPKTRKLLK